jgi:hypothetical protein
MARKRSRTSRRSKRVNRSERRNRVGKKGRGARGLTRSKRKSRSGRIMRRTGRKNTMKYAVVGGSSNPENKIILLKVVDLNNILAGPGVESVLKHINNANYNPINAGGVKLYDHQGNEKTGTIREFLIFPGSKFKIAESFYYLAKEEPPEGLTYALKMKWRRENKNVGYVKVVDIVEV